MAYTYIFDYAIAPPFDERDGVTIVYPDRRRVQQWLKILKDQKPPSEKLCSQCASVDWDEVESRAEGAQNKSTIVFSMRRRHYLRQYLAWPTLTCDLCRLLSYNAYVDLQGLEYRGNPTRSSVRLFLHILKGKELPTVRYGLRKIVDNKAHSSSGQAKNAVIVCSWPANSPKPFDVNGVRRLWTHIAVRKDAPNATLEDANVVQQLSPSLINYATLRGWLSACRESHASCTSKGLGELPGFKLIDCRTRTVISVSDLHHIPEYIALSYIWGKPATEDSQQPADTLQNPPRVIDDFIILTLKMGLRYVWIDRYCIKQDCPYEEKQPQLKAMGAIYKSSYATIIAAAGSEPSHGLPGVSLRRLTQPVVSIGSRKLVWVMDCSTELIASSKWATRGWTFQEGLMPTRRIIFTDHQVYFQCCSTFGSEQIPQLNPLETMLRFIPFHGSDIGPTRFSALVEGYIDKELTNDADTINAFRGVLEAYAIRYRTHSAWAVPIKPVDNSAGEQANSICSGLGMVVGLYLLPVFDKPCFTRRPAFPSWSWAGWKMRREDVPVPRKERKWNGPFGMNIFPGKGGTIEDPQDDPEKVRMAWNEKKWAAPLSHFECLNTTATLHSKDGEPLEWDVVNDALGSGVLDEANLSHMITLDCWVMPLSVDDVPHGKIKYFTNYNESEGAEETTELFLLDDMTSLVNDTILGIYLGCHPGYEQAMAPVVMVARKVSKDAWERVGEFYPSPETLQVAAWKCNKDMQCGTTLYCEHFPLRRRTVSLV